MVETGEGRTPRPKETLTEICYKLSRRIVLAFAALCQRGGKPQRPADGLRPGLSAYTGQRPELRRPVHSLGVRRGWT